MKKAERAQQELEQAQQEAQTQAQQELQQMQQQAEAAKQEAESLENEKDRQTQIEIALINSESKKEGAEETGFNMQKLIREHDAKNQEIAIKERELDETVRSNKADEDIDRSELGIKRSEVKVKAKAVNKSNNA